MSFLEWLKGSANEKVLPQELTDENFEAELKGTDLPVLIDVWSPSCGPCAKLAPIIASVADRHAGRVKVYHVNAANSPRLVQDLGVGGTPTVLVMRNGEEMGRVVGFRPRSWFDQMIETEFPK